jgi:hypothetical protein
MKIIHLRGSNSTGRCPVGEFGGRGRVEDFRVWAERAGVALP